MSSTEEQLKTEIELLKTHTKQLKYRIKYKWERIRTLKHKISTLNATKFKKHMYQQYACELQIEQWRQEIERLKGKIYKNHEIRFECVSLLDEIRQANKEISF